MNNFENQFNNEAAIYDKTAQFLLLGYNSILERIERQIKHNRTNQFYILDVGCGTGNLLGLLRNRFPNAVIYALDSSFDMLEIAKKKKIENINYVLGDLFNIENYTLPYFDVIVTSFVFHNFLSVKEHKTAMFKINQMLSVNGKFILADLVDFNNPVQKQSRLVSLMRKHGLSEEEIGYWLEVLDAEDYPLTVEKNVELLQQCGYEEVNYTVLEDYYSALFIGKKKLDVIQVKSELLFWGVKPNEYSLELYKAQNPQNITKTGNNGIFLTVDGLDALVGINHTTNEKSPYHFVKERDKYSLTKYGDNIGVEIEPIVIPDWAFFSVSELDGDDFSKYFVYEGHGFLHLAYKACSFNNLEKCKFCSVKRRKDGIDNNAESVCYALDKVLPSVSDSVEICLGGGTYQPLEENVKYFKQIVKKIRYHGKKNPIWIEMIPPTLSEIQELIDLGATSFGFNIEIWDDKVRKDLCPGKSKVSKQHYIDSCKYVVSRLGPDRVGSCIIVGLDSRESIKEAIDSLLNIGVQPCLLQYKNYDTDMGSYSIPVQYQRDFFFLSDYAAKQAKKRGMLFQNSQGCLKCNCCTIMHDIQKRKGD